MKLRKLLYENVLNEFNKNEIQAIATKLKIDRSPDLEKILNKLKSQGMNYKELKLKLGSEIKSIEDLNSLVTTSKTDTRKTQKKDADIILDNDKFFIVSPKSKDASCFYGKGTKWCTSADIDNMFDSYTGGGVKMYYIFDKNKKEDPTWSKVAIAVYKNGGAEGFDAQDSEIDIEDYCKKVGLDIKLFKSQNGSLIFFHQNFIIMYYHTDTENWRAKDHIKGTVNLLEWLEDTYYEMTKDRKPAIMYLIIDDELDQLTDKNKDNDQYINEQKFKITTSDGTIYCNNIVKLMVELNDLVDYELIDKAKIEFA